MKKQLLLILTALTLTACASKPANVIPLSGGAYKTTGIAASKEEALKIALAAADNTCSRRTMRPVVTNEETAYKGTFSEGATRVAKKSAETVALFTGLFVPTPDSDDDYHTTLNFKCE